MSKGGFRSGSSSSWEGVSPLTFDSRLTLWNGISIKNTNQGMQVSKSSSQSGCYTSSSDLEDSSTASEDEKAKSSEGRYGPTGTLFGKVMDHIYKYLSREDVLNCRLTCSKWCSGVNEFLIDNPFRSPHRITELSNGQMGKGRICRIRTITDWLVSTRLMSVDASVIMNHISKSRYPIHHTINLFLGRSATINLDNDYDALMLFLSQYGKHIWFLRTESKKHGAFRLSWVLIILLHYVPNIRSLDVAVERSTVVPGSVIPPHLTTFDWNNEPTRLPKLPQIESIRINENDIFFDGCLASVLLNAYSHQLRGLCVQRYTLQPKIQHMLSNVTVLQISVDKMEQLWAFSSINSPVARFELHIVCGTDDEKAVSEFDLGGIVTAVERFKITLRSLFVEFPCPEVTARWGTSTQFGNSLDLPKLETLGLSEFTQFSFNLILRLLTLRSLHISKYRCGDKLSPAEKLGQNHSEMIDLHERLQNIGKAKAFRTGGAQLTNFKIRSYQIYMCRIWYMLPKLHLLTVAANEYNSAEFEYHRSSFLRFEHCRSNQQHVF